MTSALASHPLWKKLKPYLRIEKYAPDGGHRNPRIRIEWKPMPEDLREAAIKAYMPCVACGSPIWFIRERRPAKRGNNVGHLYYAPCCPLILNVGCSRGNAARAEYLAVRMESDR